MFKRFGSACILALGIAVAGYFVAYSIGHFHNFNRYVSVKGLAEKTVHANEALMTLRFSANGDSLQAVYTAMQHSQKAIFAPTSHDWPTSVAYFVPPPHPDECTRWVWGGWGGICWSTTQPRHSNTAILSPWPLFTANFVHPCSQQHNCWPHGSQKKI